MGVTSRTTLWQYPLSESYPHHYFQSRNSISASTTLLAQYPSNRPLAGNFFQGRAMSRFKGHSGHYSCTQIPYRPHFESEGALSVVSHQPPIYCPFNPDHSPKFCMVKDVMICHRMQKEPCNLVENWVTCNENGPGDTNLTCCALQLVSLDMSVQCT